MATLALSRDLLNDYAKLEKRVQNRVSDLADTFQRLTAQELRNSKGINLERHTGAADERARTIRITDNFRGIILDVGDDETFILTRIDTHDATDQWMARNTFRVNEATGALEVRNVTAIEAHVAELASVPPAADPLFAHRKDKEFQQLGIDPELVPALRVLTNEDQLQGLLGVLPQTQADALILLTGDEPVENLYRELAGDLEPGSIGRDDLAAALRAPATAGQFKVVESENELADMLARPLAQWRTFLHHSQRDIAYRERPYNGPVRVTGGAGTGKTVVAMHRALALSVDMPPDSAGKPILFTTFTRNLAQAIERDLRALGGTDLLDVVEVLNVDRVVHRVITEEERIAPTPIHHHELMQLWQDVIDENGIPFQPEFLHSEWEQVILAQGLSSRSSYFAAPRTGRGIRLDRRGRAAVWHAVEQLTQRLVERNRRSWLQMADAAAGYLRQRTVKPYRHVIVDEAQDLHESQWHLLRAAVPDGPNDLFIVGDSHQRIYDRRSSLSKVGINVRGRSRRLRINYRTTHEIIGWALALLEEAPFDDLDEGREDQDLAGYHSFLHGPRPVMSGHRSSRDQLDALVSQVKEWVDAGIAPEDIGVAGRTAASGEDAATRLRSSGLPVLELGPELEAGEGVRVGTMHRMKGLEFRCVAVVDVDDDHVPASWDLTDPSHDEVQHRIDLQRERCLLYVACTRARDQLWVGWSGRPSRFLGSVLGGDG